MNPWPVEAEVDEVHLPRPGHADLAGVQKFGFTDVRNVLERASARETAARVAAGALAKAFLKTLGVTVLSHVTRIGSVTAPGALATSRRPTSRAWTSRRCAASTRRPRPAMVAEIDQTRKANESLGGHLRGARLRRRARPGLARVVGGADRRPARAGGDVDPVDEGRGHRGRLRPGRAGGLEGPRRDLLVRGARLPPRDEPRGRGRGRHDHRGPGGRARGDEAAADAHQAAALGGHRDEGAGAGAARAHRLVHRARRRRGRASRWWRWCWPLPTARSSAGTTSTTCAPRSPPTASGSDGGPGSGQAAPDGAGAGRLHGRRQVHGCTHGGGRARRGRARLRPRARAQAGRADRVVLRPRGRGRLPRARGGGGARAARAAPAAACCRSAAAPCGSERVREALRSHTVVQLEVDPEDAWRRASGGGTAARARPGALRAAPQRPRAALRSRWPTRSCPPAGATPSAAALPALTALSEAPPGTRLVWAGAESGSYPVFFGEGLIASGFLFPRRRAPLRGHGRERGQAPHGRGRGADRDRAGGGAQDARRRPRTCCAALARAGAERGDLVVAVGGGVVGDLAGFCAAVYQRGMRHVQVPTTLVAQVDSAYGGKTGVDLPEGKNYAGAYHQPSAVLCDPAALDTLPPEELAAGYVEVVKTALIAGGPLWARVRQGGEPDLETVIGCARTKLAVVAEDERDGGRRQVLNLGPHGGPRHRGRHRLHALPARRGGGDRPARGPPALGPRGAAGGGGRPAGRPRAAARLRGGRGGRRARARGARQEALRRPCAVRAGGGARRGHAGARGAGRTSCARRWRR